VTIEEFLTAINMGDWGRAFFLLLFLVITFGLVRLILEELLQGFQQVWSFVAGRVKSRRDGSGK
jgi:hypothetical protein